MKAIDRLYRFFIRFRYPVSLPEDIANALGIELSNFVTFEEFVERLTCPTCRPTRLSRFMPRDRAEAAFQTAQRKEHFKLNSLYSYYFSEGWLEFVLEFDENALLRRLYLHHKNIKQDRGIEIALNRSFGVGIIHAKQCQI